MRLKSLILSILVLAALSAAVWLARRPAPPAAVDARVGQSLVDRTAIEKAAKVRFSDQGKTVSLAQANGTWRVTSYYDMPVEFTKLSSFIGSVADAKIDRLVTTSADRIARLEFNDTKIELLDAADAPLWSITLGKTADTGGRYVRFGTEQKAYLASLNAWLDTDSKNWANTELVNLKADDIAKVEIPFGEGGPIAVTRAKKEDPWTAEKTPAGQKVKADRISTLLGSLATLRFTDTSAPTDPAVAAAKAAQERTLKLTTFDNKTLTVSLSRKPEEKKIKPPTATGPAALGNLSDLTKKDGGGAEAKADTPNANPLAPEFETIPAGPVYAAVTSSDGSAPINTLMQKRAFQVAEHIFTGLPQKPEELFEPVAPPPPAASTPAIVP